MEEGVVGGLCGVGEGADVLEDEGKAVGKDEGKRDVGVGKGKNDDCVAVASAVVGNGNEDVRRVRACVRLAGARKEV